MLPSDYHNIYIDNCLHTDSSHTPSYFKCYPNFKREDGPDAIESILDLKLDLPPQLDLLELLTPECLTELLASGLIYSRLILSKCSVNSVERGFLGGESTGGSSVYFESKLDTSRLGCAVSSVGFSGGSSFRS